MIKMKTRKESALALFAPMWITGEERELGIKIYNVDEDTARSFLEDHWGVYDKEELIEQIERMSNADGHMPDYKYDQENLLNMDEKAIESHIKGHKNKNQRDKLTIVDTYKYELMNCGGDAFDICRGQFLASIGFECGLLTREEAWSYVLESYDKFCTHFDSWEQYVLSYNAGRQYWNTNLSVDYVEKEMKHKTIPLFFKSNSLFKEFM